MLAACERIGVLGGMGPLATADFYAKLISATRANRDQDHLPMIISADPRIPDRTLAIVQGREREVFDALLERVEGLKRAGAVVICTPCNTAHVWMDDLAAASGMNFIPMPEAAAAALRAIGAQRAVLLASRGTSIRRLYDEPVARVGLELLRPTEAEQTAVDAVIAQVKAGDASTAGEGLAALAGELQRRHPEATLLLACTELPIAAEHAGLTPPRALDATEALARACLAWAMRG